MTVDAPESPQADPQEQWASTADTAPPPQSTAPEQWANTSDTSPQRSWADKLGIPREPSDPRAKFGRAVVDAAEGAGSMFMKTMYNTNDLARRVVGMPPLLGPTDKLSPEDKVRAAKAHQQTLSPRNLPAQLGGAAEQIAEFAVPMSNVSKATQGANLLTRTLAEAGTSGGISALQSGGDPSATTMGTLAGAAGPLAGAAVSGTAKAVINRMTGQNPRPLSQEALAIAAKYGVPLTQGMVGGSKTVQAVEKMLGHTVAPDLYEALMEGAQQGVNRAATGAARGFAVDQYAAGDSALGKLLKVADDHAQDARQNYSALDAIESDPANIKSVQTGTKEVTIGTNYTTGQPITKTVPVYEDIALPVDMTTAKAQLKPIRDMLRQQITPAQQQYSKALHAVQNVLDGPDVVSASTAEGNLSAIKAIQREGVNDKTKYLAGKLLDAMEPEVARAVAAGGPDATNALTTARQSWRNRSQVLELVDELAKDTTGKTGQTKTARALLKPADASYPMLQKVLAIAPGAKDDLGSAYLSQVFGKADAGEFTNPNQARNLWNQIGPRTKAALFTPQHIQDVDATLDLAKRVGENPNPSGTGIINSLLKLGILVTKPVAGSAAIGFGRAAAKVLYDPAGAAAMKQMMQGTANSQSITLIKSLIAKGAETAGESQK